MLYDSILKINAFTENILYEKIFWSLSLILFIVSFMLQFFNDKYCDIFTEVIRVIHHFSIFFIYCGVFAPTNYLFFVLIFSLIALLSWLFTNNTCFCVVCSTKKFLRDLNCHIDKHITFKIVGKRLVLF